VGRNLGAGKTASFFKTKKFVAIRTYSLYVEGKKNITEFLKCDILETNKKFVKRVL
jgi:hypothetical protein